MPPVHLQPLRAGVGILRCPPHRLTATPNKQAFGFFNQNLVMEYGHEQAVADGANVDFDVYRIRTEISEQGGTNEAGIVTQFRDRQTRRTRWEKLDEDLAYTS